MLNPFPNFRPIEIADKGDIDKIIRKFPPYSDFNFASLFSWNTAGQTEICILNDNLAIKLKDYTSDNFNFSFIGSWNLTETAEMLLGFAKQHGVHTLNLVPKHTFDAEEGIYSKLKVIETPDHDDYILDINKIAKMEGKDFHKKRNLYKKFEKENLAFIKILKDIDEKFIRDSEFLFTEWARVKQKSPEDYQDELNAFKNEILLHNIMPLYAVCLIVGDKLVGFTICEIIDGGYVMIHFEKTDPRFTGISEYLMRETAKFLKLKKLKYINFQQDLGLEGLKYSKQSYRPIFFLKKYSIEKLTD